MTATGTLRDTHAQAARALMPDLPAGTIPVPHWTHTNTTLIVTLNTSEHARREATQTGPLPYDSMPLLDILMRIPENEPVSLDAFTAADRRRLRAAIAPGAIDITTRPGDDRLHVIRHAVRPLRVHLAVVSGGPIGALDQASSFAPFCARAALLRKDPGDEYLFDADFYGIGIAVRTTTEPAALLPPTPWRPQRHTPAGWWFQETVYKALLTHPDLLPTKEA